MCVYMYIHRHILYKRMEAEGVSRGFATSDEGVASIAALTPILQTSNLGSHAVIRSQARSILIPRLRPET